MHHENLFTHIKNADLSRLNLMYNSLMMKLKWNSDMVRSDVVRNTLLAISFLICLFLVYWLYHLTQTRELALNGRAPAGQIAPQAQTQPQTQGPPGQRAQAFSPTNANRDQTPNSSLASPDQWKRLQQEATALTQRLNTERAQLEARRQELLDLQQTLSAQREVYPQDGNRLSSQIASFQQEIQTLTDALTNQQSLQEQVYLNREASLQEVERLAEVEQTRVNTDIALLEQNLQQVNRDIEFWNQQTTSIEERTLRLNALQAQRLEILAQLEALRPLKVQAASDTLNQTQSINAVAAEQQAILTENQMMIRDRIRLLQGQIQDLQGRQKQVQENSQSLTAEIQQTQKALQEQTQQVQALERALQEKQGEFTQIR